MHIQVLCSDVFTFFVIMLSNFKFVSKLFKLTVLFEQDYINVILGLGRQNGVSLRSEIRLTTICKISVNRLTHQGLSLINLHISLSCILKSLPCLAIMCRSVFMAINWKLELMVNSSRFQLDFLFI